MGNRLRVVVVDDEPLALEFMSALLQRDAGIELVGTCRNGREALSLLSNQPVDVVFLDIQMPGLSGLDVIRKLQADVMPLVVFATAHDDFALQAFDINAVDYLLKPIDAEAVSRALTRARERLPGHSATAKGPYVSALMRIRSERGGAERVLSGIDGDNTLNGRLAIKDGAETQLLPFDAIDWVDAAGDYMCIHSNGDTHIMRSTMSQLLERLPDNFVRVHRSTIVNVERVHSYETLPKGELKLSLDGGARLKVSRNYKDQLTAKVGTLVSHLS